MAEIHGEFYRFAGISLDKSDVYAVFCVKGEDQQRLPPREPLGLDHGTYAYLSFSDLRKYALTDRFNDLAPAYDGEELTNPLVGAACDLGQERFRQAFAVLCRFIGTDKMITEAVGEHYIPASRLECQAV